MSLLNSLNQTTIARKLLVAAIFLALLILVNGLLALNRVAVINAAVKETHGNWLTALHHLNDARDCLGEIRRKINGHLLAPSAGERRPGNRRSRPSATRSKVPGRATCQPSSVPRRRPWSDASSMPSSGCGKNCPRCSPCRAKAYSRRPAP